MPKTAAELQILLENAEKRAVAAAQLAAENEQWARKHEKLLDLAIKREHEATTLAQNAEKRAVQAVKLSTENAKWARDSAATIKQLTKSLTDAKAWAEAAEKKATAAHTTAAEFEKWAEAAEKRAAQAQTTANEFEKRENLERCREIFLSLRDEEFVRVIDTNGTLDEVAVQILETVV